MSRDDDVPLAPVAFAGLRPRPEDVEIMRVEEVYDELANDLVGAWLSEMNRVGSAASTPARRRRLMLEQAVSLGIQKDLARLMLHRFDLGWTTSSIRDAPSQLQTQRMVRFVLSR